MVKELDQEPQDQDEWDKFAVKATWKFLRADSMSTLYALVPDTSTIRVNNCSEMLLRGALRQDLV